MTHCTDIFSTCGTWPGAKTDAKTSPLTAPPDILYNIYMVRICTQSSTYTCIEIRNRYNLIARLKWWDLFHKLCF
jgi:hypothetical protein